MPVFLFRMGLNMRTNKSNCTTHKTERKLMNEHVRTNNNTMHFMHPKGIGMLNTWLVSQVQNYTYKYGVFA